ncbi:MAG TPA: hypothetical protein VEI74_00595 [Candidatus Methylomirabilis sp.]|nr:hypothetical protein [Candidatus Methylomirabilis sp.]
MTHSTNSETRVTREQHQWFIALAFGVDSADAVPIEPPAMPSARDVLP